MKLIRAFVLLWLGYFTLLVGFDTLQTGWPISIAAGMEILPSLTYSTIVAAIVIVLTIALSPRRIRQAVRDTKRLAPELDFEIDETGLRCQTAIGMNSLQWSQLERWLENSRVMVLIITQNSYYTISKTTLDIATQEALRERLIASNVPNR